MTTISHDCYYHKFYSDTMYSYQYDRLCYVVQIGDSYNDNR